MKMSIRWKLLISIALPVTTIYLIVLFVNYHHLKSNAYFETERYLKEVVEHNAERFHSEFSTAAQVARSSAQFLSSHPKISETDLYQMILNNVAQSPFIYGSCIAFEPKTYKRKLKLFAPYAWRDNGEFETMDLAKDAYDYLDWSWYSQPKELGKAVWTKPYFDEGAGNIIMTTYAVPFYKHNKILGLAPLDFAADLATDVAADLVTLGHAPERQSKLWGVTTIDVNLEKLQELSREKLVKGAQFTILDKDGTFVSHSNSDFIMKESIFSIAEKLGRPDLVAFGKKMLSGKEGVDLVEDFPIQGTNFIVYVKVPSTQWVFAVMVPESLIMAQAWKELMKFSVFMLVSLLVIVFVILIISFKVTHPIMHLSKKMQTVGEGNLEVEKTEKYPNDEIGSLANSFYSMIHDLRDYTARLEAETRNRESVESELRIARTIQASLIPRTFPPFPTHNEFGLFAQNVPAKYVAGDFYDYFLVSEDMLAMMIADVSGKGVSAALFMAVIRTLFRIVAGTSTDPAVVLNKMNEIISEESHHGLFVTLVLVYYDVKTGEIRYANAGHPSPYLMEKDGSITQPAPPTGTVLGVFPEVDYKSGKMQLRPDERLVFYTDGVTEAKSSSGDLWGYDNFQNFLHKNRDLPLQKLCEKIFKQVNDMQDGHLSDDVTVVFLKRCT